MKEKKLQRIIKNPTPVANLCYILSNQWRLLVLCHLCSRGKTCVTELQNLLGNISQSALSQHLAVLRKEGIVKIEKQKQTVFYTVADPRVEKLLNYTDGLYYEK